MNFIPFSSPRKRPAISRDSPPSSPPSSSHPPTLKSFSFFLPRLRWGRKNGGGGGSNRDNLARGKEKGGKKEEEEEGAEYPLQKGKGRV